MTLAAVAAVCNPNVASPSLGPKDTIYVPDEVFNKGVFLNSVWFHG